MREEVIGTVQKLATNGIVFREYPIVTGYPYPPRIEYSGQIVTNRGIFTIPRMSIQYLLPFRHFEIILPSGMTFTENWINASFELDTFFVKGKLPDNWPGRVHSTSIASWQQRGESFDIQRLYMKKGSFQLDASGFIGLDRTLQPTGVIETKAIGHDLLIKNLRDTGLLPDPIGGIVQVAVRTLSTKHPETGEALIAVPVKLSDQAIRIGVLRVASLPAIDWGRHNSPVPYQ